MTMIRRSERSSDRGRLSIHCVGSLLFGILSFSATSGCSKPIDKETAKVPSSEPSEADLKEFSLQQRQLMLEAEPDPPSPPSHDQTGIEKMQEVQYLLRSGSWEDATQLLETAKDPHWAGVARSMALQGYASIASKSGRAKSALSEVWALRGSITGGIADFADPVFEAMIDLGPVAAEKLVPLLAECSPSQETTEPPPTLGDLADPTKEITIEVDNSFLAAVTLIEIIKRSPDDPRLATFSLDLARCLACGDRRVRLLCTQALANVGEADDPKLVAYLRDTLQPPGFFESRAASASVLAALKANDKKTLRSLSHALRDKSELVSVSAAYALVRLGHGAIAKSALKKLSKSSDPEIAQLAKSIM